MTISEQSRGTRRPVGSVDTPFLALDPERMERNIARLEARLRALGVALRPHVKTHKSLEIGRRMSRGIGPITVSTLREAEYFFDHGFRDILYAVGIVANKVPRIAHLVKRGARMSVIVDSAEGARALSQEAAKAEAKIPTLIEIDSDGHRAGVRPGDTRLLNAIADALGDSLLGVMTHAGDSYNAPTPEAIGVVATRERDAVVAAATMLRSKGHACPVVSVGSTPTALAAKHLEGVTEVRAGVFVFFDLVMAGIDVCRQEDIALSVLATVIGRRADKGWLIVDAGWMALSRDRGTAKQAVDQGYGVVCDLDGRPIPGLTVVEANQEHGVIASREGRVPELAVGARLRILPNHACATGAQHERYHVVDGGREVAATWERFSGW